MELVETAVRDCSGRADDEDELVGHAEAVGEDVDKVDGGGGGGGGVF